jgi:putative transposase
MSLRDEFVRTVHRGRHPITEICRAFGISEKTGHKWLARFATEGKPGLEDREHTRHTFAHQLPLPLAEAILELRKQHPTWGPRKLHAYLVRRRPTRAWPAPSTIGALLARHGLVRARPRPRSPAPAWAPFDQPLTVAAEPNDVWTTDYKGEFRLGSGMYCFPLTVVDAASRFLLGCTALASTASVLAQQVFTQLFRTYGLPRVIRSDNGIPFASPWALSRLSTLSVWWIRLGIRPERIALGAPQQNGAHERLHKTLKAETTHPAAATATRQQQRFTAFRREYNTERPHEALDLNTPASRYAPSPRLFPRRVPPLEYPAHAEIRRVQTTGIIKWRGERIWLTHVLAGEDIALEQTPLDDWTVSFGPLVLGTLHSATRSFTPDSYWKINHMNPNSTP